MYEQELPGNGGALLGDAAEFEIVLSREARVIRFRKRLLWFWAKCIHRNTDAHYKSAEKLLWWSRFWRNANVFSAIVVLFVSTSEQAQDYIGSITNFDTDMVIIASGIIFLITSIYQNMARHSERYFAHINIASSFSEIRREIMDKIGAESVSDEQVRRIGEKYALIVENSPMVERRAWRSISNKKSKALEDMLEDLYSEAIDESGWTASVSYNTPELVVKAWWRFW